MDQQNKKLKEKKKFNSRILNYISRLFTNFKNLKKVNYMFTIIQYVNNFKMRKRQLKALYERKSYNQKSKPKIMNTNVDQLQPQQE